MTQLDDVPAEFRRRGIEAYARTRHLRLRLQQFHNSAANMLHFIPLPDLFLSKRE